MHLLRNALDLTMTRHAMVRFHGTAGYFHTLITGDLINIKYGP